MIAPAHLISPRSEPQGNSPPRRLSVAHAISRLPRDAAPGEQRCLAVSFNMSHVIDKIRETTWLVLALACVAYAALTLIISGLYAGRVGVAIEDLQRLTAGLLAPPLVANLPVLVVMGLIIFAIGRLQTSDVGFQSAAIVPALLVLAVFWIAMQGVLVLGLSFGDGPLQWHEDWRWPGCVGGLLLGQLLGTALVEETLFRGFLLPQFYLKASRFCRGPFAVLIALLISLMAFSLAHIPHDVFVQNVTAPELLDGQYQRLISGLLYSAAYLVTRNLLSALGFTRSTINPRRWCRYLAAMRKTCGICSS